MWQVPKSLVALFAAYYWLSRYARLCTCVFRCVHVHTMVLLKRNGAKKRWELGNLSLGSIGLLLAVLVKAE